MLRWASWLWGDQSTPPSLRKVRLSQWREFLHEHDLPKDCLVQDRTDQAQRTELPALRSGASSRAKPA